MTTTQTLAELATGSYNAIRVLESHGLDYCCGGKLSLDQACQKKGLNPAEVLGEIERNAGGASSGDRDWKTAPLDELARHVVATHHEYLKPELPVIGARLQKVRAVHGSKDPQLLDRMGELFGGLRAEMELHMHKEEAMLFPFIEQYGKAQAAGRPMPPVPFGTIANPIRVMEMEHTEAGDALSELRTITKDYALPEWACATVRALYAGLAALEADLHVHIHLENNIMFPRAIALETA